VVAPPAIPDTGVMDRAVSVRENDLFSEAEAFCTRLLVAGVWPEMAGPATSKNIARALTVVLSRFLSRKYFIVFSSL
jgi:hypothetical protein